jgi:hypothetical protein
VHIGGLDRILKARGGVNGLNGMVATFASWYFFLSKVIVANGLILVGWTCLERRIMILHHGFPSLLAG